MVDSTSVPELIKNATVTEHLANERTFLAWIRTGVGIMAFGFVIEKFALFIKRLSLLFEESNLDQSTPLEGYSTMSGVLFISLGAVICLLAFAQYLKTRRQIFENCYRPSILLNCILTMFILLMGIFMIVYLNTNAY